MKLCLLLHSVTLRTNLTDRIYLAVHCALTLLVCARYPEVKHWPWYVAWNLMAMGAILVVARKQHDGQFWEFAHDWLPVIFFVTAFEEVSFLSLAVRGAWQNPYLIAWESAVLAAPPAEWLHRWASPWFSEVLELGYLSFYPLYPMVAGMLWAWRGRPGCAGAFRRLTDALSVTYAVCYTVYLLFPTRSPSHNVGLNFAGLPHSGGPFHFLVRLIAEPRRRPWQRLSQLAYCGGVRRAGICGALFPTRSAVVTRVRPADVRRCGERRIPLRA